MGNLLTLAAAAPDILGQLERWRQQYGDVFTLRLGNKYVIVICSYKVQQKMYSYAKGPQSLATPCQNFSQWPPTERDWKRISAELSPMSSLPPSPNSPHDPISQRNEQD